MSGKLVSIYTIIETPDYINNLHCLVSCCPYALDLCCQTLYMEDGFGHGLGHEFGSQFFCDRSEAARRHDLTGTPWADGAVQWHTAQCPLSHSACCPVPSPSLQGRGGGSRCVCVWRRHWATSLPSLEHPWFPSSPVFHSLQHAS